MSILYSRNTMEETCMMIAKLVAKTRSKDPKTKVGAVVFDPVTGGMFVGYNGFPPGFPDRKEIWENRDDTISPFQIGRVNCKHAYVIHAEANAIRKALMALGDNVSRCILYSTNIPCERCMAEWIAPNGIKEVYFEIKYPYHPATIVIAKELKIKIYQFVKEKDDDTYYSQKEKIS